MTKTKKTKTSKKTKKTVKKSRKTVEVVVKDSTIARSRVLGVFQPSDLVEDLLETFVAQKEWSETDVEMAKEDLKVLSKMKVLDSDDCCWDTFSSQKDKDAEIKDQKKWLSDSEEKLKLQTTIINNLKTLNKNIADLQKVLDRGVV